MAAMVRGGGETFDLEMSRHLMGLGCKVTVLTGRPVVKAPILGPGEWWGNEASAKDITRSTDLQPSVIFLRTPWLGWFPWDKIRGGWRLRHLDLLMFEQRAARWIMEHQHEFDIVQVCELPELVKCLKKWRCRIPVSMRLPGPQLYPGYGNGALEIVDLLIASGTSIAFYKGKLNREVVDIPNGVDTEKFRPLHEQHAGVSDKHKLPRINRDGEVHSASNPMSMIYVARLTRVKNHAMLIKALAKIKERGLTFKMAFVGSGPILSELVRQIRDAGLTGMVTLLGETGYDEMPRLYQSTDLSVIASDYESFGFVALEAMASGLPVVSTRTGWIPGLMGERIETGVQGADFSDRVNISKVPGGLIVPVNDAEAMADAILWMAEHKSIRSDMGCWNRKHVVENFSWDSSAGKLLGLYRELKVNSVNVT